MWLTINRVSYGLKNVEVYWRKMLLGFVPSVMQNLFVSYIVIVVVFHCGE
jgi:hypothetical protein